MRYSIATSLALHACLLVLVGARVLRSHSPLPQPAERAALPIEVELEKDAAGEPGASGGGGGGHGIRHRARAGGGESAARASPTGSAALPHLQLGEPSAPESTLAPAATIAPAEPPVDHSRFAPRVLADGRVELRERPRVETAHERREYIRAVSQNRVHTMLDETSHGIPWLWGGEPLTTGEGDRLDYRAKRQYLDETFDERSRAAAAARGEDELIALSRLPAYLDAIWNDTRRPLAERRRLLHELWDECDPATAGGRAARARIEAFGREHPR